MDEGLVTKQDLRTGEANERENGTRSGCEVLSVAGIVTGRKQGSEIDLWKGREEKTATQKCTGEEEV